MQKQKHPGTGQSQGYRYNGNNGTEGGGAGSYQASQIRICPQGAQQQDPKQQPQQTLQTAFLGPGPMQHLYAQSRQNHVGQFYSLRGSSHPQRMPPQPRPSTMPITTGMTYPVPNPGMIPAYLPGNVQQMMVPHGMGFPMAQQPTRHQSHGTAMPNAGPTSNYMQQSCSYFVQTPQALTFNHYPSAAATLFSMPLRNQQATPNSAQYTQQQQPTQVPPQIIGNPQGQGMVAVGMQSAQVSAMSMAQHPPFISAKKERKRERAIAILHPITGEDVLQDLWENNSSETSSTSHTPQPQSVHDEAMEAAAAVVADFASRVSKAAMADTPENTPVQEEIATNGPSSRSLTPPTAVEPPAIELPVQPAVKLTPEPAIPTVSAKTNSPTVELHRPQPPVTKPAVAPVSVTHFVPHNPPPPSHGIPMALPPQPAQPAAPVPQQTQARPQSPVIQAQPPLQPVHPQPSQHQTTNTTTKETHTSSTSPTGMQTPQSQQHVLPPTEGPKPKSKKEERAMRRVETSRQQGATSAPPAGAQAQQQPPPSSSPLPAAAKRDPSPPKVKAAPEPAAAPTRSTPTPPPQQTAQVAPLDDKETNGDSDDVGKAQQRPKQNKQQKKKDLNRKGVEKEGTDMDAFVEMAPEVQQALQQPPASLPVQLTEDTPDLPEPSLPVQEKIVPEPVPVVEEKTEVEVNAMVAAKNEENTKSIEAAVNNNNNNNTSGNVANNNTQEAVETEDNGVIPSMTIERSAPALQYNYKEDQWSPINQEGKKVYDRAFLMEIRNNPLSSKKPENLMMECDLFRDKPNDISNNNRKNPQGSSSINMTRGDNNMSPNFIRSSMSQRGSSVSGKNVRNAMQGRMPSSMGHGGVGRMQKPGSSYSSANLYRDEPNLHKVANSWKPTRFTNQANVSEEELKTQVLLKTMRGILNKLTPQKFERLLEKVQNLGIDNENRLKSVVNLVFEKAIDEPSFSSMYADLCANLQNTKVPLNKEKKEEGTTNEILFRKVLLVKCQEQFEKTKGDQLDIVTRTREIEETKDLEKQKEMKLILGEDERKIRVKAVGLVRFIGELYKKGMLTPNIMHTCIGVLLARVDEEPLECLCKLLTTVGKDLEQKSSHGEFDDYFNTISKLAQKSSDSKVSSRIRFMLQDVIDLRMNKWIPRRDENKPKTIEQIHKDAERETILESNFYPAPMSMSGGGGSSRGKHMNDDRRRNQKNQVSEDGWLKVNQGVKSYTTVEASKFLNIKGTDVEGLGTANQFVQWSLGSNAKRSDNSKQYINRYAVLGQHDDKKSMLGPMSKKGVTPSPSLEKERVLPSIKQALDMQRRSGSGSGPSSRESSRQRYGTSPATSLSSSSALSREDREEKANDREMSDAKSVELLPDNKLLSLTRVTIEEWSLYQNIEDTCLSIEETFIGPNRVRFIHTGLLDVVENSKSNSRTCFGKLLVILIKDKKLIQTKDVIEGFSQIMANEDLVIDLPLIWKYLAQLLVPLLAHEVLNFANVKIAAKSTRKENFSQLLVKIIELLIKEKGPSWIRTQWELSRVQIVDCVPGSVDKFVADNNLGFLTGSGEVATQPDDTLTCEEIEEKLLTFMKNDSNKAFDYACDWVKVNVSDTIIGSNDFIKAVTRAVLKGSIVKDKLCHEAFECNRKLIKKFVDNVEKRELACLYAVQNLLANEMVAPPSLISEIFEMLYNAGTISYEGFIKWKSPDQPETEYETHGKGVLLKILPSFFVMLSENNDTEEES
ncbi:eukaryotic translation initiation factor 4 gamma 1-like isoform X3 [Cimex lectularius]|uniref:Uncharacterized protein n=1 Tax=Cimex lectularius TaxID=79782 RepID=A0A8I6SGY0_CIMLE|nr:eukaryotic translation initiation factor 4 gamma 1-like isoform X3 [Cimex lectularius]XP_014260813.1 eukaryotic translation initiation factor 4 gamma 1-like isoform X3 [Cimex lectularius]XP_014260814.1 eukaryotic translation initiation factor 4 gamma 1-like isoform X3 [Cimex lectularius]